MPTSKKQVAANRRNAKKSTGPTSTEGKAVVSRNAIKHGLHACDIILKSPHLTEDRTEYEQLLDSLIDELKPQGTMQDHLVLKIANALWRYRRVINAETARINRQLEDTADSIERGHYVSILDDPDDLDEEALARQNANRVSSQAVPDQSFRETLQHYEMRLDRQLTRAFTLLHRLQHPDQSDSPAQLAAKNFFPQNKPISQPPLDSARGDKVPTAS
ncbi:MAG: hypothetical protein OEV49_05940 [candidate division Zixibacteria bacterium]|nr:hypothetical protein [candidate division Zixibacteria bacterium]MDH3937607.1 hypothetical protein [candidate division Zixibacteria bacterium]MDH4032316.1 hypothetical protein [candidate division Zixibacteria bacterium]